MSDIFFEQFDVLTRPALASILDQSEDCIKLVSLDGTLEYMNVRGQSAMQIDDFAAVSGKIWTDLWPESAKGDILHALARARKGSSYRFEGFCPTAKGEERYWDVLVAPMFDGNGKVVRALAISRNITEHVGLRKLAAGRLADAEKYAEIQELAAREMRHRLKNLLAVIQAISSLVAARSRDLPAFLEAFRTHLSSMANAQRLLSGTAETSHKLDDVLDMSLEAVGQDRRIEIGALPDVTLSENAVQIAALTFGELSTNSMKHGALARPEGQVRIDIVREDAGVRVLWVEDCGEQVEKVALQGGSGVELIKRMTSLGGKAASFDLRERGLTVSFWLPSAA